jgi:hypothetical protein
VAETIGEQSVRYVEVHNDAAQRFALTIRPYRAVDGQTEGAVLTLVDVTLLRGAEAALAAAEQQISALEKNAFMRGGSN